MNEDLRLPTDSPLLAPVGRNANALPAIAATLPGGAFTASVLLDLLALVAETPEEAHSRVRGAVDLLKVGLGASLAALALGLLEALKIPSSTTPAGKSTTKDIVLDGAIVAVYLLNLAAREEQLASGKTFDPAPTGLSVVGLALLGAAGKLKLPAWRPL